SRTWRVTYDGSDTQSPADALFPVDTVKQPTTTQITLSPAEPRTGDDIVLTARVLNSKGEGVVDFLYGDNDIGEDGCAGVALTPAPDGDGHLATCDLGTGLRPDGGPLVYRAAYRGSATREASASGTLLATIERAIPAITWDAPTGDPGAFRVVY